MNKKVIHSVPNSTYGLIFVKVRVKHGRFLAKMWALYGQNSSFCDFLHVQSVIELFSKQLNSALNVKHHFTTYMYNNSAGHYSAQTDQDNSLLCTCRLN